VQSNIGRDGKLDCVTQVVRAFLSQDPVADVMQQAGQHGFIGQGSLCGERAGGRRNRVGVLLQPVQVEPGAGTSRPLRKYLDRHGEVADRLEAQITHRLLDVGKFPGQPEKR